MTPKDALTGSTGAAVSRLVTVTSPPLPAQQPPGLSRPPTTASAQTVAPNSAFHLSAARVDRATGAITFKGTLADPGRFSWLATFQNGKFGAFASAGRCKSGYIRRGAKCLPAKIVFAKGGKTVVAAGTASFTLKPSASAARALRRALKKGRGVRVSIVLSFESARGGGATSHTLALTVKLKK
jgi:hypothetical protein